MSDQDICGTCGLFVRGPDVQGDACPGHDSHETAPNGVPYRDMWAGGVGPQPQLHADQSIGNPGTLPREAYQHSDTPRTDAAIAEDGSGVINFSFGSYVHADFARQLERIASGYRGLCNPMTMSEESFQKLRALDKQFDALLGEG